MAAAGEDWTRAEVEATVASYFRMLELELRGLPYNKSQYRRELMRVLGHRSPSAIERKHMNISAVLNDMHAHYIDGYKPYSNYQKSLLPDIVEEQLLENESYNAMMGELIDSPDVVSPSVDDILAALVDPPDRPAAYDRVHERAGSRLRKTDFMKRDEANRRLGSLGESFVLEFERARLVAEKQERLASRVEHISVTQGDGAGFDILSFDASGRERLVEVKTTRSGKQAPFYVSSNELAVSQREIDRYMVYRVFSFSASPRLYVKAGPIDRGFFLTPDQFVARVS